MFHTFKCVIKKNRTKIHLRNLYLLTSIFLYRLNVNRTYNPMFRDSIIYYNTFLLNLIYYMIVIDLVKRMIVIASLIY